jgi:hypothetical protein
VSDAPPPDPTQMTDLPEDPALAAAVLEVESHVAGDGWDQPARLYALVDTARIVAHEPALASQMGLDESSAAGSLTPVEQDGVPAEVPLEDLLQQIGWPDDVAGCAAVVERLVLPPDVDADIPADPDEAERFAREHPDRQEVRIAAGVTRAGASYCALRLRAHDDAQSVVDGTGLVPGLLDLLRATLSEQMSDPSDQTDEQGSAG